jgi:hypothetical protein
MRLASSPAPPVVPLTEPADRRRLEVTPPERAGVQQNPPRQGPGGRGAAKGERDREPLLGRGGRGCRPATICATPVDRIPLIHFPDVPRTLSWAGIEAAGSTSSGSRMEPAARLCATVATWRSGHRRDVWPRRPRASRPLPLIRRPRPTAHPSYCGTATFCVMLAKAGAYSSRRAQIEPRHVLRVRRRRIRASFRACSSAPGKEVRVRSLR